MKQKNAITKTLGPKSKLNKRTSKIIVESLRQGLAITRACVLVGITPPTFYRWLELGQKNVSKKYRDFYLECRKAEVECENRCIQVVQDAAQGKLTSQKEKKVVLEDGTERVKEVETKKHAPDWKAAMTFLERKYPERWGRYDRLRVGSDSTDPIIPKKEMLAFLIDYVGEENSPIDRNGKLIKNYTRDMKQEKKQTFEGFSTEQDDFLLKENR